MKTVSRRDMLTAFGLATGTGLAAAYGGEQGQELPATAPDPAAWRYVSLTPAAVAAEAYRIMPEGGYMYGVFRAVLMAWSKQAGNALASFPFHMFRYGEGGIAGWGSVCGALNAGAALIGLFENDKTRREHLIMELFSWYEQAELPAHRPSTDSPSITASVAGSVLCHISIAHWCTASGTVSLNPSMRERCRRLTADVAAKTVELLNHVQSEPSTTATANQPTPQKSPRPLGKMSCTTCHPAQ